MHKTLLSKGHGNTVKSLLESIRQKPLLEILRNANLQNTAAGVLPVQNLSSDCVKSRCVTPRP